ncbi:MAG: DUF4249 family protein [Saprospiraceae bacterium]
MKKVITLLGFTILFLTNCFKDLDYDLDFEGQEIVIRGTISPQDGAIIQVSHTLDPEGTYFFDTLDLNINNAIVKLYANDTLLQQISYSGKNGLYLEEDLTLNRNVAYHLTVEVEGFPSARTEKIEIPQLPQTTFNLVREDENELRIDIEVADNPKASYYQLVANGYYDMEVVELYAYPIGTYEQWEICGLIETGSSNGFHITDDCFKEKTFLFPLSVQIEYFQPSLDSSLFFIEPIIVEEVTLRFRSTIKERYDFVVTSDVPEGIDNAFREPAITFSNVIGGHGYFSAYQETVYIHKL